MDDLTLPTVIYGYEVDAFLAVDNRANTVRAYDRVLKRRVVLRLPRGDEHSPGSEQLRNEAVLLTTLRHPNVARLEGYREIGGEPFLILEEMTETVGARLRTRRLTVFEAVGLATRLAGALSYLQRRGLTLTALEPDAVAFAPDGTPRLYDLGSAHLAARETPPTVEPPFSPYSVPEVVRGAPPTAVSAVYSLGLLVYAALTGGGPFDAAPAGETARAILFTPVPTLATLRSDVPAEISAAIERAMDRDPARRFESPELLVAALAMAAQPTRMPASALRILAVVAALALILLATPLFAPGLPFRIPQPKGAEVPTVVEPQVTAVAQRAPTPSASPGQTSALPPVARPTVAGSPPAAAASPSGGTPTPGRAVIGPRGTGGTPSAPATAAGRAAIADAMMRRGPLPVVTGEPLQIEIGNGATPEPQATPAGFGAVGGAQARGGRSGRAAQGR